MASNFVCNSCTQDVDVWNQFSSIPNVPCTVEMELEDVDRALTKVERIIKKKTAISEETIQLLVVCVDTIGHAFKKGEPSEGLESFWARVQKMFEVLKPKLKWKQNFWDVVPHWRLFGNIASIYEIKGDFEKSLEYLVVVLKALISTSTKETELDAMWAMNMINKWAQSIATKSPENASYLLHHVNLIEASYEKKEMLFQKQMVLREFKKLKLDLLSTMGQYSTALKLAREILKADRSIYSNESWEITHDLFNICTLHVKMKNSDLAEKVNQKVLGRLDEFHKDMSVQDKFVVHLTSLFRSYPLHDPMHRRFFEYIDEMLVVSVTKIDKAGLKSKSQTVLVMETVVKNGEKEQIVLPPELHEKRKTLETDAVLDCIESGNGQVFELPPKRLYYVLKDRPHSKDEDSKFLKYLDSYASNQCCQGNHYDAIEIWERCREFVRDIKTEHSIGIEFLNLRKCYLKHVKYYPEALELALNDQNRFKWNEKEVLENEMMEMFMANGKIKEALTIAKVLGSRRDALLPAFNVFFGAKKYNLALQVVPHIAAEIRLNVGDASTLGFKTITLLLKANRQDEAQMKFRMMVREHKVLRKDYIHFVVLRQKLIASHSEQQEQLQNLLTYIIRKENPTWVALLFCNDCASFTYRKKFLNLTRPVHHDGAQLHNSLRIATHFQGCLNSN